MSRPLRRRAGLARRPRRPLRGHAAAGPRARLLPGTVFEITSPSDALGSQSTIVAGGRYDGLVESLGGPPTPAFGFALGVERGVLTLAGAAEDYAPKADLFVAHIGEAARRRALVLAHRLRVAGFVVEVDHRPLGVKAQFKRADKVGARFTLALGDAELASGRGKLKDMATRSEAEVALDDLAAALAVRRDDLAAALAVRREA